MTFPTYIPEMDKLIIEQLHEQDIVNISYVNKYLQQLVSKMTVYSVYYYCLTCYDGYSYHSNIVLLHKFYREISAINHVELCIKWATKLEKDFINGEIQYGFYFYTTEPIDTFIYYSNDSHGNIGPLPKSIQSSLLHCSAKNFEIIIPKITEYNDSFINVDKEYIFELDRRYPDTYIPVMTTCNTLVLNIFDEKCSQQFKDAIMIYLDEYIHIHNDCDSDD